MTRISHALTMLSIVTALTGITWYAIAASCTGSLPPSNAISGWATVSGSTVSGQMGGVSSYRAYDGAVPAMQESGIRYFAQRIYKNAAGKHVTLDIYQLSSPSKAKALYDKKRSGYKNAKPLTDYTSIKDKACVGTLGKMSFGVLLRGLFVAEVSMSKASTSQDRATVKSFLTFVSNKLAK